MTVALGTEERPLRVAIIGAGPSGFYAAGALLKQANLAVSVDMFERLPTPYGLVRYGVAPDHQNIKSVSRIYERTAADPRFRFFGNVAFGTDLTHDEMRHCFDAIIYAVGAQSDRRLNIPGEDLPNSLSATEFVAWYNGHPDYIHLEPDLSCETAMVIGVGNVAMDVARILAKSVDELKTTDIADYALAALAKSKVRNVHIVARRGPAQAKFTNVEIREFGHLEVADILVDPAELKLDAASSAAVQDDTSAQKNLDYLHAYSQMDDTGKPRKVYMRFLLSPVEIEEEDGKIGAIRFEKNRLRPTTSGYINAEGIGVYETVECGMVLRSVGYRGVPLPGVPFDERRGTIPNQFGRVVDASSDEEIPGEYVVGWAKRGPTGVIGTNKPDAVESVNSMLEDMRAGRIKPSASPDEEAVVDLLTSRQVRWITNEEWQALNALEVTNGKAQGRPRVKFTDLDQMLEVLDVADTKGD